MDEHFTSVKQPYLFNGKELDQETGLYYYGARYYDPKVSLWLNTDPLSGYNPTQETEHYIDGQHNGGVYNPMNMATYSYTYQNPVKWIDPNGKQVHFLHGTGNHNAGNYFSGKFSQNFQRDFGSFNSHQWSGSLRSGGNSGRIAEGHRLSPTVIKSIDANIKNGKYVGNGIIIGGHSHGGNVARVITKDVYAHLKNRVKEGTLDKIPIINLVMVNTPVLDEKAYQFGRFDGIHINAIQVDAKNDLVAGAGQILSGTGAITEKYNDADKLFEYKDQISPKDCLGCFISNHAGQASENVNVWYDRVKANIQKGSKQ